MFALEGGPRCTGTSGSGRDRVQNSRRRRPRAHAHAVMRVVAGRQEERWGVAVRRRVGR
jgi:hypothetical protein